MRVWISSPYKLFAESLVLLVCSWGFEATAGREPGTDVALCDLTASSPPYPAPPPLPTLAIIGGDEGDVVMLLHQHYRGYLKAIDSPETLKRALEAVRRGEIWADRRILTKALDSFMVPRLTPKEEQVFRLLARGLSNRTIARELNIAEGTVKMHVSHLFDKLGAKSRSELIARALGGSQAGHGTSVRSLHSEG